MAGFLQVGMIDAFPYECAPVPARVASSMPTIEEIHVGIETALPAPALAHVFR